MSLLLCVVLGFVNVRVLVVNVRVPIRCYCSCCGFLFIVMWSCHVFGVRVVVPVIVLVLVRCD